YAYPPHVRKFEIIGGLFGETYRLSPRGGARLAGAPRARNLNGSGNPPHQHAPERPLRGVTRHAPDRRTQQGCVPPPMRLRRDAMFHSVTSGMSRDHILISCITREGEILNALRRNLPNVGAVHVPHTTCGAFMAFISMKKIAEGEPQMAIMAALGTE